MKQCYADVNTKDNDEYITIKTALFNDHHEIVKYLYEALHAKAS